MEWDLYPLDVPASSDTLLYLDTDANPPAAGQVQQTTIGNLPVGGGGGGGVARMPQDILSGWVCSNVSLSALTDGINLPIGATCAAALIAQVATSFSKVVIYRGNAGYTQTGTGGIMAVTDSSGNWLAHATNLDSVMSSATVLQCFVDVTLNTTVTPAAGQVLYVVTLFPSTVTQTANMGFGLSANKVFVSGDSSVTYVSFGTNGHTTDTSIANPFNPASINSAIINGYIPFFALK